MKSEQVAFRAREWLSDKIRERRKDLGFRDTSSYLRALVLRDLLHSRTDEWLKDVANAGPTSRDFLMKIVFALPRDQGALIKALQKCGF